jgi:hypothetical protein
MLAKALGVFGETEEIVLFANPVRLGPVDRAVALDQVLLLLERLT